MNNRECLRTFCGRSFEVTDRIICVSFYYVLILEYHFTFQFDSISYDIIYVQWVTRYFLAMI